MNFEETFKNRIIKKLHLYDENFLILYNNRKIFSENNISITKTKDFYYLKFDDLKIKSCSADIGYIAKEVICEKNYDFYDDNKEYIMIDIGCNVGITSLYMATKDKIKQIYAFDAFEPTIKIASENLYNNKKYSSKIKLFPFGLSDKNKEGFDNWNSGLSGSMSTFFAKKNHSTQKAKYNLKNAAEILKPI